MRSAARSHCFSAQQIKFPARLSGNSNSNLHHSTNKSTVFPAQANQIQHLWIESCQLDRSFDISATRMSQPSQGPRVIRAGSTTDSGPVDVLIERTRFQAKTRIERRHRAEHHSVNSYARHTRRHRLFRTGGWSLATRGALSEQGSGLSSQAFRLGSLESP